MAAERDLEPDQERAAILAPAGSPLAPPAARGGPRSWALAVAALLLFSAAAAVARRGRQLSVHVPHPQQKLAAYDANMEDAYLNGFEGVGSPSDAASAGAGPLEPASASDGDMSKDAVTGVEPVSTRIEAVDGDAEGSAAASVEGKPLGIGGTQLFCYSLMVPEFYEMSLIKWQYENQVSIFLCDLAVIYSNRSIEVAPGLVAKMVAHSLKCDKGGEFGTALNIDIFRAVWARVNHDRDFERYDWTAKIDPDAVFFPLRLRGILSKYQDAPGGVYLNNCPRGLHGPVEVFSKTAVENYWAQETTCQAHFTQLCSGPCLWGEDMFIDQCLQKVLHVKREYSKNILVEDHCDPPPNWMACPPTMMVAAFHPFKTVARYSACLATASR